jgi:lipopolysaccharide export system protein LptC
VLLLGALLSGWSAWRQRAGEAPAAAASHRPDYVLDDFELVSLDSAGKEAFTLRAPSLKRDPADGTMALASPVFLLPEDDGLYWDLRARTGWISADSEEMRLRGDVVAVTDPTGGRNLRMETEELDVFPNTRAARSAAAVTVSQPGTTMRGIGMEADLADKRFQLTSKVQTRYVPTRR